jgi:hypothetical protein
MTHRTVRHIVAAVSLALGVLFAGLSFSGCVAPVNQGAPAEAKIFVSLQASAAVIDSLRASYEAAHAAGQIDAAAKARADRAYNVANDAIILAAEALRAAGGMQADTPEEVDAAVKALVDIITEIVPPKAR